MEDGDEAEIAHALAAISRARAKTGSMGPAAGIADPRLRSEVEGANTISQALSVVKALGLKLNVRAADAV